LLLVVQLSAAKLRTGTQTILYNCIFVLICTYFLPITVLLI
jgi:hypothetical protein